MTPVAGALDIFQGEQYMYMGLYTPCVLSMINVLKQQQMEIPRNDPVQFLLTTLLESIGKR